MKRTLIIGLITSNLILGQAQAINAVTLNNPIEKISAISTQTVFGRSSKPVKEPIVEEFSYIDQIEFLPAYAIFEKNLAMAKQEKEERIEKARQEEQRALEAEQERLRVLEEQRLESIRKQNVSFNDMDVTQPSGITPYELETTLYNVVSGSGLAPYASYFVEAEQVYGINALFLCALAAEESGWGKYAGGNGTNITGYAVYSSSHSGTTFEGGIRQNIMRTAELIAVDYTSAHGKYKTVWDGYNNGKSIYEVNQKYCFLNDQATVDNNWARKITKIAVSIQDTYHLVK